MSNRSHMISSRGLDQTDPGQRIQTSGLGCDETQPVFEAEFWVDSGQNKPEHFTFRLMMKNLISQRHC